MLPPDKAVLSQVYSASDKRKTCRVCSAEHRDTYIFRKGWRVTGVVDVEPDVSQELVSNGACVCLCNRCGQAYRKQVAMLGEHKAMVQTMSNFAQEASDEACEVDDVDGRYEIDASTSQISEQPMKRQKSVPYHAFDDPDWGNVQGSFSPTEHPSPMAVMARKSPARRRTKTQAEMDALMTIEAANDNTERPEYAGYAVTKTNTDECHFTFFWIRKAANTEPLLVSVGHDKRKSGHFTYHRAPGLPDHVPGLDCTSRRQVLAWMLTHFRVPNRMLNARLRKDIPVFSAEEACYLAGLDPPKGALAAKRDGGAPMVPKTSTRAPSMLTERRVTTRCITTTDLVRSISSFEESERSEAMDEGLPSPLTLLNISGMELPSPSDLLLTTSVTAPRNFSRASDPLARVSEEPEMDTINVVGTSLCCGVCGLSDHKTPKCPLQRGSGISISISSLNTSQDGSGRPGSREDDREGGLSTADGLSFKSSDLLDNFGSWSEVSSPDEAENLSGWEGDEGVFSPSCGPASLIGAIAVLSDPESHANEVASVLDELVRLNLSIKELAGSGIVAMVAGLLSTSPPVGRVAEASRTLCHKWLSQAKAAVQDVGHR